MTMLTQIRECNVFPSIVTWDGEYYCDSTVSPIRIRNLFTSGEIVDVTIAPASIMPPSTEYNAGRPFNALFNLMLASQNLFTTDLQTLPIYVHGDIIYVIGTNADIFLFSKSSGALLGSTNINPPLTYNVGATLYSFQKSIGFMEINGAIGIMCFTGYGTNAQSGAPENGQPVIFGYETFEITSPFPDPNYFPTGYLKPVSNVTAIPGNAQIHSGGVTAYASFGTTGGVTVQTIAFFSPVDNCNYTGSGSVFQPDSLPLDYPNFFGGDGYTNSQLANYTGYGDILSGISIGSDDALGQSYINMSRTICDMTNLQVKFNALLGDIPVKIFTSDGLGENLEISNTYDLNGSTITFNDALQTVFIHVATGNTGLIAQATNGNFYYLSTGEAPPPPVVNTVKKPKFYPCANYSRLF